MTGSTDLARASCADPLRGRQVVRLGPGDHAVSSAGETAMLTVLGSCVAACIRDAEAGVGGMNHFMLPESADGSWGRAAFSLRYGNHAMERLINEILRAGGRRERLEVKVFGGAQIGSDTSVIGSRNADYVDGYLKAEGLAVLARVLRGKRARRLVYLPVSGRAFVLDLPGPPAGLSQGEMAHRRALRPGSPDEAVEMFQ